MVEPGLKAMVEPGLKTMVENSLEAVVEPGLEAMIQYSHYQLYSFSFETSAYKPLTNKVWYGFLIVYFSCVSLFSYDYKADLFCFIFYLFCFFSWRYIIILFIRIVVSYSMESFVIECSLFVTAMFSHVTTADFHWNLIDSKFFHYATICTVFVFYNSVVWMLANHSIIHRFSIVFSGCCISFTLSQ